ncbi:hypothetical protein VR610_05845 [Aquirufa regiilacus]
MKKNKYLILVFCILFIMVGGYYLMVYLRFKKEIYYSNGGFERKYTKEYKFSLIQHLPLIHRFTNFIQSSNPNFVIAEGENKLFKITIPTNYNTNGLIIEPINYLPKFGNNIYYTDEFNNLIYALNEKSSQLLPFDLEKHKTQIINKEAFNQFEPVIIYNNKIICSKKSISNYDFKLINPNNLRLDPKNNFKKLIDQGQLSYQTFDKSFIYISLFSHDILKLDSNLNPIEAGHTIDTISQKPKVKFINNSILFSSSPRITNYDFFILKNKIFVRSVVSSNNDLDFKNNIVFDIYDINKHFKYLGSVSLKNDKNDYPTDMHILNNEILILLYEDTISVYKIET